MNFACFNCWTSNDENEEKCSNCGMDLRFPLINFPEKIDDYVVEKSLGRGYYGVTYVAKNDLDQPVVLKVTPQKLYRDNNKNFVDECKLHAQISKGTNHLLKITSIIKDKEVNFGKIKHKCDIAVLEYIEGRTLKEIIDDEEKLKIETIVQITIDLLEILQELFNKKIHHNDLHPANIMIQVLSDDLYKYKNIDKFINVIAIDLGSISETSKSEKKRKNDVHHISKYIQLLSKNILENPHKHTQKDFRIALELDRISKWLMPSVENHRIPEYEEIIDQVEAAYKHESNPWKQKKFVLKNIGQFYNAQNLLSWNVPDLFVEEDQWLNDVSSQGPLVITGMRGCGKTMLLKSMQIHARIKYAHNIKISPLELVKNDGFLGVFISSNRLLDEPGNIDSIYEPLTKLFLSYGIELILALRHLKEENHKDVVDDYYLILLQEYKLYFPELENQKIISDVDLEIALHNILALAFIKSKTYKLPNPIILFSKLAKTVKKLSETLSNSYILFLLDDVSTRYLSTNIISELLSSLIFQDENCAFKFTSEEQTMQSLIYSPGLIEKAKVGRDIEVFDLGTKVYEKTKGVAGKAFALKILEKRKEHAHHPNIAPKDILGDKSLKEIAVDISRLENKNEIYCGLSALTGVCVGDIGDIILLYKNILEKRRNDDFPVDAKIQNECFLELSNIRLQDLKKRGKELENYALSFAEAANNLLIDSFKKNPDRLREYTSIYINNTSGNTEEQYIKIRELVDAGVFVFLKGSKTLRTSGSGNNPTNQFILLYRKILGLSKPIGLSQSDRFELKNNNLVDWINLPEEGTQILKRSVEKKFNESHPQSGEVDSDEIENTFKIKKSRKVVKSIKKEKTLFDLIIDESHDTLKPIFESQDDDYLSTIIPKTIEFTSKDIPRNKYNTYITSSGFEERTFESLKRATETFNLKKIILIKYSKNIGYAEKILEYLVKLGIDYEIVNEDDLKSINKSSNEKIIFDITGMSKSLIFLITKLFLEKNKTICIMHTFAKSYAPKDEILEPFYSDLKDSKNTIDILDTITNKVPKGEELINVSLHNLVTAYNDKTKNRVLIATCNVKYEKLFQLIDKREFDNIDIFVSNKDDIKNKIAKAAAKVIQISHPDVVVNSEKIYDLDSILASLTKKFYYYFINQNNNIEFGLTGNKLDALAFGVIASKFKISKCWYLRTSNFDTEEFSEGVSDTKYYEISISPD